jgi:hypothetical protein
VQRGQSDRLLSIVLMPAKSLNSRHDAPPWRWLH